MERYLLFAGNMYYPYGGWNDLVDSYETIEDAVEFAKEKNFEWWHVVDPSFGIVSNKEETK